MLVTKAGASGELLAKLLDAYAAEPGAVAVDVMLCGPGEQERLLRDGRADVALLHRPFDATAGFDTEDLHTEGQVAVLPAGHPLAGATAPAMAEVTALPDLPLPRWPRPDGSYPDGPGPQVRDHTQLLQLIALGRACAVMPESLRAQLRDDHAAVPVPDAPAVTTVIAWPPHSRLRRSRAWSAPPSASDPPIASYPARGRGFGHADAVVDGTQIAYRVVGDGPPVVLVHAAGLADFFAPLQNSVLQRRARVISYHRIGYGQSQAAATAVQISDQARHCEGLLEHLGYEKAHVVGHSSGGVIALELARRSPQTVATLSLLEPSLPVASSANLGASVMQPAYAAYLAGDKGKAIDTFLGGVCGPDYPQLVDELLPAGARRQAAENADTLFAVEAPSVGRWISTSNGSPS